MDKIEPERIDEEMPSENPEDVAALYSYAKLHGTPYRDYSASHRANRAMMRHRMAETEREAERGALLAAEAAAAATEKAAREAEEAARFLESASRQAVGPGIQRDSFERSFAGDRANQTAAELARRASMERIEASRRAEAVAAAEAAARREEREIAEAHASAQRQARRYEESDMRRKTLAGPQPMPLGGEISDPYTSEGGAIVSDRRSQPRYFVPEEDMLPARYRQSRDSHRAVAQQVEASAHDVRSQEVRAERRFSETDFRGREQRFPESEHALSETSLPESDSASSRPGVSESRAKREAYAVSVAPSLAARLNGGLRLPPGYQATPVARPEDVEPEAEGVEFRAEVRSDRRRESIPDFDPDKRDPLRGDRRSMPRPDFTGAPVRTLRPEAREELPPEPRVEEQDPTVPAWIYSQASEPAVKRAPQPMSPVEDTLQHTRERVASRWFALKGVFGQGVSAEQPEVQRVADMRAPLLTVFSLAGGVGKTSLIATLGRALSSVGERVLLTDTTSHGLLPFYFGANELRPGAVRTFSPPEGSTDAPIYLVSYDVQQKSGDAGTQDWLSDELTTNSRGMQRVLVDLTPGVAWVARRLVRMNSTILVPVAPDMNSVISLQGVEKFFAGMVDAEGRSVQPFYVMNQFDASLALHIDVREVMRQQLGDRLLPFAIRRSTSVSEALAEGMTVMDYAPDSPVAADYVNLVSWLRMQSAPATAGFRNARWSER